MNSYQGEQPLVHQFEEVKPAGNRKIIAAAAAVVIAGIFSGFLLHRLINNTQTGSSPGTTAQTGTSGKTAVGSSDTKTFRDSAEGTLEAGGVDGEGTHRLIRPGGASQTVYLTSSVLDLNQFVGKKVHVWGETFNAKKAGWLMDVGKVELIN
jgi:hypothetical protein